MKTAAADYPEYLTKVLKTVIDGIITIDDKGIIHSFNPAAERIFGYASEEVIGQNVKMLMPSPYHNEHDGYISNYLKTGEKKVIGSGREVRAQRKDGGIFPMELGISEMSIANNIMFVGTIRDISDRREAEQKAQDEKAKLQAILDNTVDGMITIDERGNIESFNKACTSIFGYSLEDVIGKNVKMLMPPPYHDEHDGYLQHYQSTGENKIIGIGREVQGKRKDGSLFPLDLSVSVVSVEGRKVFSGIVRDISERKEAEKALKLANEELEEFAYRTSHDLCSPLLSSIGLLEATVKSIKSGSSEEALSYIPVAIRALQKLETLVTDILALTASKKMQEERQYVRVEALVEDALEKFANMEGFQRLDIQTDFTFSDELFLKKSRVMLIVENLISNAIKYQDTNQSQSFIKISTYKKQQEEFVFEVRDNGLGIPKDKQDSLFVMFQRFHPKTSFGSGLGLYMMKKSADILQGELHYEGLEEGSAFRLVIPESNYTN